MVRGELSWRELSRYGIAVRVTERGVQELGVQAAIPVTVQDIAWGWLRTSANDRAFREWARFVHGAIGLVELDVEGHPLGEAVLEALWDAAFGEALTPDMTDVMRRVVTGG